MKCKYEHDEDCCCSCADQYMCKCKQPCEFLDPMTNADRIRAMSDEELAEYIAGLVDDEGLIYSNIADEWIEWLRLPAEE